MMTETHLPGQDSLLRHEVLDRTHMIAEMVQQFLCAHPAVLADKELGNAAAKVADALGELYQLAGRE